MIEKLIDEPYWDELEGYLRHQFSDINYLAKELITEFSQIDLNPDVAVLETLAKKFVSYHFHVKIHAHKMNETWLNRNIKSDGAKLPIRFEYLDKINLLTIKNAMIHNVQILYYHQHRKEDLEKENNLELLFDLIRAKRP